MRATLSDLDEAVALIAEQQAAPERNIGSYGIDADDIRAELGDLEPRWEHTACVLRADDGTIIGTAHAEWDEELGRAWIQGPWVAADDHDAWTESATVLFDAVLAIVPLEIPEIEVSGDVRNVRLAVLAGACGLEGGQPVHVLELANAQYVASEPPPFVRAAVTSDTDAVAALHDANFPATIASTAQLFAGAARGERVLLVAENGEGVAGYVAGRVLADGEGYIDFIAVDPAARRCRIGEALITSLVGSLIELGATTRVCLVVDDNRVAARAVYEKLGFVEERVIVGYRRTLSRR